MAKKMNSGPEAGSYSPRPVALPALPCPALPWYGWEAFPWFRLHPGLSSGFSSQQAAQRHKLSRALPVPQRNLCHRALALRAASSTGLTDGQLASGNYQMQKEKAMLSADGNS